MAERKTTADNKTAGNTKARTPKVSKEATEATVEQNATTVAVSPTAFVEEDLNLDAKVTVRNLAGWDVTFAKLHDGSGDVIIIANGQTRLSRNEINAQVDNGNKLFTGIDGQGSHATVVIDDAATRRWVGFESEGNAQKVFNNQMVLDMFKLSQSDYEDAVYANIQTRAEKYAFIEAIKKLKLNDYAKMVFASNYTGYKL